MTRRLTPVVILAMLSVPRIAFAQPEFPAGLDAVRRGLTVSVVDDEGRRVEGKVLDVSGEAIQISVRQSTARIPLDRVVRIEKADSLKNGAAIGFSIGLGLTIAVAQSARDINTTAVAAMFIGYSVVWTSLGIGVDALVDSRRTLYQRSGAVQTRMSPIVGRGVRGGAVSVSW
jgi:hypothetical protein